MDHSAELKKQIRDIEKEGEISNVESKEDIESAVAKLKVCSGGLGLIDKPWLQS